MEKENTHRRLISVSFEAVRLSRDAIEISVASRESFMSVSFEAPPNACVDIGSFSARFLMKIGDRTRSKLYPHMGGQKGRFSSYFQKGGKVSQNVLGCFGGVYLKYFYK